MKSLLAFAFMLLLSGCAISHKSHLSHKGSAIDQEQVALIQPGSTDRDWVLRNLGTPDRTHAERDGLQVFEYITRVHEKTHTHLLFVLSSDREKIVSTIVTRIVMRNGIVESVETVET